VGGWPDSQDDVWKEEMRSEGSLFSEKLEETAEDTELELDEDNLDDEGRMILK